MEPMELVSTLLASHRASLLQPVGGAFTWMRGGPGVAGGSHLKLFCCCIRPTFS